jgi:hypothetical protein
MSEHQYWRERDGAWSDPIVDPGDAGAIGVTRSGICELVTGAAAQTRTLANPAYIGQQIAVVLKTDGGGACTVTVADGFHSTAATALVFSDAGDVVLLVAVRTAAATFRWRLVSSVGVDVPTTPISSITMDDDSTVSMGTGLDVVQKWNASYLEMGPAVGMWKYSPLIGYAGGISAAYELVDDFFTYDGTATVGNWLAAEAGGAGGTFALANTVPGGQLVNTRAATDDDDGGQISQVSAPFMLAADKKIWFECRFKLAGDVAQSDVYIGLCSLNEDLTAVSDNLPADGVMIHKDDGAATLKLTASKGGTNTGGNANIGTLVLGAWTTVGFYAGGVTKISPYVDGVIGSSITATIPDDTSLGVIIGVRNGDATSTEILTVDYVKCVQLR